MLAECPLKPADVLLALNQPQSDFFYIPSKCFKIAIYARFAGELLPAHAEDFNFTIRRLSLPLKPEITLCVVHFPSKLHWSDNDQTAFVSQFIRIVNETEQATGHSRTVLVGDFNMNPYEDGMVSAHCLHAVMTREIAQRRRRKMKFESNLLLL